MGDEQAKATITYWPFGTAAEGTHATGRSRWAENSALHLVHQRMKGAGAHD